MDSYWPSFLTSRRVAFGLVILTLVTRLPFVTRMLYSWDSVNFAFALQRLDVTRHAPHPPGYPYYVGLARLFDLVLHDANASLILVSLLFACLSVAALYGFGRTAFDEITGLLAGLSLLASVTFWAYGVIALSYMTLAFFSIATAWLAYQVLMQGRRDRLLWLTALYSIGGGFRPDLLLFLAPLWLASLARATWRERVLNGWLALVGFALWFAPTVWLSGGLEAYWRVLAAYFGRDVLERYSATHVGWHGLIVNLRDLASYIFYALYAQALLLVAAFAWLLWRGEWRRERVWWFLAAWIGPMLAFYTFIHIGDPGYVFAFLPALCLLIARFVRTGAHAARGATADENLRSNGFSRSSQARATKVATTKGHIFRADAHAAADATVNEQGHCEERSDEAVSNLRGQMRLLRYARNDLWGAVFKAADRGARETAAAENLFHPGQRLSSGPLSAGSLLSLIFIGALVVNTGIFLFHDRPLTGRGIRHHDRRLAAAIGHVRATYHPDEVVLLAYASYKHASYYLPAHHHLWVDRFSRQKRRSELPRTARFVVLLDDDLPSLVTPRDRWEPVTIAPGVHLHRFAIRGEREVIYGPEAIQLK